MTGAFAPDPFDTTAGNLAMWQPASRYPDPAFEIIVPVCDRYRPVSAAVERLTTGCRWAEGPVWFGDGRFPLWGDIPNNRILKQEEETGAVSVFRAPSGYANGNTRDRQRRLGHGLRCALRRAGVLAAGHAGRLRPQPTRMRRPWAHHTSPTSRSAGR